MSFSRDTFHTADPDIFGVKRKKSGGEGYTGGRKSEGEMRTKKNNILKLEWRGL